MTEKVKYPSQMIVYMANYLYLCRHKYYDSYVITHHPYPEQAADRRQPALFSADVPAGTDRYRLRALERQPLLDEFRTVFRPLPLLRPAATDARKIQTLPAPRHSHILLPAVCCRHGVLRKTGHAHHPDAAAAGTAKQYQRGWRSAVVVSRRGNAVVAIRAGHHPDDGGHGAACPRADHHGQSHAHRDMAQPTHDLRRTDSHYRHVCHRVHIQSGEQGVYVLPHHLPV